MVNSCRTIRVKLAACMGGIDMCITFWLVHLNGRNRTEDVGNDARITPKWFLHKWDGRSGLNSRRSLSGSSGKSVVKTVINLRASNKAESKLTLFHYVSVCKPRNNQDTFRNVKLFMYAPFTRFL
jgi:hypothetical protein